MSKDTIAQRSNLIRNEQNPEGNTKERIADQFDDVNESKLEAPSGSGFYYLTTGGIAPSWSPINPTSYYAVFWTGSGFQSSDIYTSPLNGRVGIGTGSANLLYKFQVIGPTKLDTLNLANPTNAQGDTTFTKDLVYKPDGTIGIIDKVVVPKVFGVFSSILERNTAQDYIIFDIGFQYLKPPNWNNRPAVVVDTGNLYVTGSNGSAGVPASDVTYSVMFAGGYGEITEMKIHLKIKRVSVHEANVYTNNIFGFTVLFTVDNTISVSKACTSRKDPLLPA